MISVLLFLQHSLRHGVPIQTALFPRMQYDPNCFYWSDGAIRSRSVGATVLFGAVDIPTPPSRLVADWEREILVHLNLEPGDVHELPLARARARWPDYRRCVQAATDWTCTLGLPGLLATSDVALMACRGARYHHDSAQYGGMAFCNLFLSEDKGLDLHFPDTGLRIALSRGMAVVFDTGQPHAVIRRDAQSFDTADFPADLDCSLAFLTWELPVEDSYVAKLLHISFGTTLPTSSPLEGGSIWRHGTPATVCPQSGQWRSAG